MAIETVERDFHEKVSAKIRLAAEGMERFRVFTPFLFEDGDHLSIVLKKEGARWVLSDEAHTYMHLTYDMGERDLHAGTRQRVVANALSAFQIEDRDGELIQEVSDERYGDALYSFVQALLKISDVSYLSRERVRSTFMEDFRALLSEAAPEERRVFDWRDPDHDTHGIYTVDCRINGMPRPLFVHAFLRSGVLRSVPWLFSRTRNRSIGRCSHASATYARSSSPAWPRTVTGSRAFWTRVFLASERAAHDEKPKTG